MAETAIRHRRPRFRFRAPPPTPVHRPSHSSASASAAAAAIADDALERFLSTSVHVPNLSLPTSTSTSAFVVPSIPFDAIADESDTIAVAIRHVGAFIITGAFGRDEAATAVEIAAEVFRVLEGKKRWLDGLIGWRYDDDGAGEEFYWPWRAEGGETNEELDRVLRAAMSGSYRAFREEMENIAMKMESIAKSVANVLSQSVQNPNDLAQPKNPSIICITQYNTSEVKAHWNEYSEEDPPRSCAMCLHLCGGDQDFCLRYREGSTLFRMPASSVLVTIGKHLEELSSGELKSANGEVLFELTEEPDPFTAIEFLYCPSDPQREVETSTGSVNHPKIIRLRDQLLFALVALAFYWFWTVIAAC